MRRLDYLHGLGVTAIWLMPFQVSPHRDDGYDVSDYYGVDPRYGTIGDFVEFAHGAKQRGIRVLIDLVVNHTSDEHGWFKQARKDPGSKYRDWYVWSKKKPPRGFELSIGSARDFATFVAGEIPRWTAVVKASGVKSQ